MCFKYTEYLLNAGLFTGKEVNITVLHIRSNNNTCVSLAVTMALKSDSRDFNCQDDGQWSRILLRHWLVIFTPALLPFPSWHFQFNTS